MRPSPSATAEEAHGVDASPRLAFPASPRGLPGAAVPLRPPVPVFLARGLPQRAGPLGRALSGGGSRSHRALRLPVGPGYRRTARASRGFECCGRSSAARGRRVPLPLRLLRLTSGSPNPVGFCLLF